MSQYPEGSTMAVWYDEATEIPNDVCIGWDLGEGDTHVEQHYVVVRVKPDKPVVRAITAREAAWHRMRAWLGLAP